MKTQRFLAASILFATLIAFSVSAAADEKMGSQQTALGNTTISGYVNSSFSVQLQPQTQHETGGWWHTFLHWFQFHAR
jgi:hypothetical protein